MNIFFKKIKRVAASDQGRQRGVAIYLAAVTLMLIMAMALGISLLSVYQIKSINETGASVVAFAAAETGIEWALASLTDADYDPPQTFPTVTLTGDAKYTVSVFKCGPGGVSYCAKSIGTYHGAQRAIKISQ